MWIVALALRRPYTFVVMALVIILLMPLAVLRTPIDIFPDINIPVISVVWNFTGFAPQDMADRIITNSERGMTVTVNNIEHIESQSVNGVGVIKVFFQPDANIQTALAQVTAIVQTTVRVAASGHHAAAGHHLHRVLDADCATRHQQPDLARPGAVRSRAELSA